MKRLGSLVLPADPPPVHDPDMETVQTWLMEGDPSVRWQAERDVLERPERTWKRTRAMVASEGWGKQLLDLQDPEGTWAQGLYIPKWTSTTYTMTLLKRLGLPPDNPQAHIACGVLLDRGDWVEGGISYFDSYTRRGWAERCVNGMLLSVFSYFDVQDDRIDSIAELLIKAPMADGGWNCEDRRGATHSSFHTTISVLEGLLLWKRRTGSDQADRAIHAGHEFLLDHQLFRSHTTGQVINEAWTRFWFPPRWHYDIMRGLDHLRDAAIPPDSRAQDAIEIVRFRRKPDGRWPKGSQYTGKAFFPLEPGRVPGRFNTLRALRVLRWWDGATTSETV